MVNDLQNIMIRNVTMIDPAGKTEDVVVRILLNQKKLKLVTPDKIELKEADNTLDANGGFILGRPEIGSTAGFIILDQDPRTNVM